MKKILYPILLVAAMTGLFQSCYYDDEEIFEETSSARMQRALKEAREMLTSSSEGWVLELYPEATQMYGGFAYTVKFDDEYVYARTELASTDKEVKSTWKMTNDDGPVLIFDGYNELLHYFSTATASAYQAMKGEFEFIVMKLENDRITLRGKKTANTLYMYRLNESAKSYLDKVKTIDSQLLIEGIKGTIGGKSVDAKADLNKRQLTFNIEGEESVSTAFCLTAEGFRTYLPVEIAGSEIYEVQVKFENETPVSATCDGLSLTPYMAEGWRPYSAYAGKHLIASLETSSATALTQTEVDLIADPDGVTYWMRGLIPNADLKLVYNKALGTLDLCGQLLINSANHSEPVMEIVGEQTFYFGMCVFSLAKGASSGSINYSTSYGMRTQWNNDTSAPAYSLVDNGMWTGNKCRCFRIYAFTSRTMSSTYRNTSHTVPNIFRFNVGDYASTTLYWPETLTKVLEN